MFAWMEKVGLSAPSEDEEVSALDGMMITGQAGFLAEMPVATVQGWRAAQDLRVGDRVLTFDNGFRPVRDIQREVLSVSGDIGSGQHRPVRVPKNAIGNDLEIRLMPDQGLLVESETVLDMMGDPFAVIPARALIGFRGIRADDTNEPLAATTIALERDEVIYIQGGLMAYCPRPRDILMGALNNTPPLYEVLKPLAARYLVRCLSADGDTRALVCGREEVDEISRRGRVNLKADVVS